MVDELHHSVEGELAGEQKYTENNCPSAAISTTNSWRLELESNRIVTEGTRDKPSELWLGHIGLYKGKCNVASVLG
jgi:hypothetical protein